MRYLVTFILLTIFAGCDLFSNEHLLFTEGVVVTQSRSMSGVVLGVDTSHDGRVDLEANVVGFNQLASFSKGDAVVVNVGTQQSYAKVISK